MPLAAMTPGSVAVALALNTPARIVPANMSRVGLLLVNGSASDVLLNFGSAPTANVYAWRLKAGDEWALPLYGAVQELWALSSAIILATAGFTYTEFALPTGG